MFSWPAIAHALPQCGCAGDHRPRARGHHRIGLRERDAVAHRPPVAVLLQLAADLAHDHADALEAVRRVEHGLEVFDARRGDFAEVAEAFAQSLVGAPPCVDGGCGAPAREGRSVVPVGDGDHVVESVGIDVVREVVMARSVGQGEVARDLHQCGAGAALHLGAARLHAEIAHHHLHHRSRRAGRPDGVGWGVVVLDAAVPRAGAFQVLGDGGFHGGDSGCQAASCRRGSVLAATASGALLSGSGVR
ncbi:hypothetical protein M2282_000296 [Variovorax boronicumulans]|nr:hypothetical protein [Variovorax boronicumulans]